MSNTTKVIWNKILARTFVVAEIGKNFIQTQEERPVAEYLQNAKALVKAAHEAGADAVKFQTHNVEDEVLELDFDSPHFKGIQRYRWVKRNDETTPVDHFWQPLQAYCDEIGVVFFSTPMSRGAAVKLEALGVPHWKVASSDILDFPMLDFMSSTGKPIIMPTGMSTLEDVDRSLEFLKRRGARVILLHAISRYPYPDEDSNLRTILFFKKRYPDLPVGFSQNSPWIEPAIAAVALGACLVEQHFTFDRSSFGPDHKVSMTPDEFRTMVAGIRAIERDPAKQAEVARSPGMQRFMGSESKVLQEGETAFRPLFRKSLMAGVDIPAGTVITAEMLYAMRPQAYARGLPSEEYERVIEKVAKVDLKKYDPIRWEVLV